MLKCYDSKKSHGIKQGSCEYSTHHQIFTIRDPRTDRSESVRDFQNFVVPGPRFLKFSRSWFVNSWSRYNFFVNDSEITLFWLISSCCSFRKIDNFGLSLISSTWLRIIGDFGQSVCRQFVTEGLNRIRAELELLSRKFVFSQILKIMRVGQDYSWW